jgi:hypothetical protein
MEVSGQLHASAVLHLGERDPGTHWIGGSVGPRASLDDSEKTFLTLPGVEFRSLGHRTHSQSLYRLRYPGSSLVQILIKEIQVLKTFVSVTPGKRFVSTYENIK